MNNFNDFHTVKDLKFDINSCEPLREVSVLKSWKVA